MAGKNPSEAYRRYIDPLRQALQCITLTRLTLRERTKFATGVPYTVALNDMDPVPLKGEIPILLAVGQIVRIIETERGDPRGPFRISTVQYFYQFSTPENHEVLSFHWTPEGSGANVVTFPHLHIGPAIVSGQTTIRPDDLHKAHIPTNRVSLESVVRLAIVELRVEPLQVKWADILQRSEDAFVQWKIR